MVHVLKDRNKLELHVQGCGVALNHFGYFGTHVHREGLWFGREFGGRKDGRMKFHVIVRVEGISYIVVDLLSLRNDGGDGTQRPEKEIEQSRCVHRVDAFDHFLKPMILPEGECPRHRVIGMEHRKNSLDKFVDVGDLV